MLEYALKIVFEFEFHVIAKFSEPQNTSLPICVDQML